MRDHSHYSPDHTGICAHCGQPLPGERPLSYGDRRVRPTGIIVTIALHLLLVLFYLFSEKIEKKAPPPAGEAITYIAPVPGKPKKKELARADPAPSKKKPKPVVAKIERLPDTITLPKEKPVEVKPEPEPPKPEEIDPTQDLSERIAARRRARGQDTTEQQGEESEKERGMRNALANIAAANGRSKGTDPNETGGVFSVTDRSFSRAQLKFRGWNPNFKRRWLTQVDVELGSERDIETAIVKKMIELIRKEKTGDFDWDSHRLQRVVKMSARVQDTAELEAFLYKEMFPGYSPPKGR